VVGRASPVHPLQTPPQKLTKSAIKNANPDIQNANPIFRPKIARENELESKTLDWM